MVEARKLLPSFYKDLFSPVGVKVLYQDMFEMVSAKDSASDFLVILRHSMDNINVSFYKNDRAFAVCNSKSLNYVSSYDYSHKSISFDISEEEAFQMSTVEDTLSYEEIMLFKECFEKIYKDYEDFVCTTFLKKI